jgi:uncharacterized protein (DUF2249 family)
MSSTAAPHRTVDIRALGSCTDRKAHVLATFDGLAKGESLVVVNDHMPNGLLRHFEERRPGAFAWTAVDAGPEVFLVEIVKIG